MGVATDGIMLTHPDVKTADPKERSFQGILLAGCQILVVTLPVGMFWMVGESKVKQHLQASAAIGIRVVDNVTRRLSGRGMSMHAAQEALAAIDSDHQAQIQALGSPKVRRLQVSTRSRFWFPKCAFPKLCKYSCLRGFMVRCTVGSGHRISPLLLADAS